MNEKLNPKNSTSDKISDTDKDNSKHTEKKNQIDLREYRPLDVVISITMHDLQAHLIKVSKICH